MVMGELAQETEVLVIGAGPGGYAAAFRAADLGFDVTMVELGQRPGGACLFRGCIPSKTFLYLAELLHDAKRAESMGVQFGTPQIDLEGLRRWKTDVVDKLASGLVQLNDRRGVQLLQGRAVFEDSTHVRIYDSEVGRIAFKYAVVATGSRPVAFPDTSFKKGGRLMNSTGALALADIPESLLVLGGGYVGLELGTVYAAFGSRVTVVELSDRLLTGVDADLVKPLHHVLQSTFDGIHLNTRVDALNESATGVEAILSKDGARETRQFDRVLVAIGRHPNTHDLGLENTVVQLDDRGFVKVDEQQRTADPNIFAVGDVVGGMMLAHKATREGKVAAEVIAGQPAAFDVQAIPAVVYTHPQIAWCGLTEETARAANIPISVQRFPWKISGRAATMNAPEGLTKIIADKETKRILGVGITGRDTEGLISEGVLAVEMGALVDDMALTIHPHPTLSETEGEAAELFLGSATHILSRSSPK